MSDTSGAQIKWMDPDTGELGLIADGLFQVDGIAFAPDYATLYAGSVVLGHIWAIPVLGPRDFGAPTLLVDGTTAPWDVVDGLQADRCRNLYVANWTAIWRVTPDGQTTELVVGQWTWRNYPSLRFGSGLGGFDGLKLYVSTYYELIEVDVGVPGIVRWP